MAKRQAVQLQAELQTDEDFEKFISQPGLLVLDVYTDWCGPCIGMINALRKVKLEQGGDVLVLAIARADTISYLHRFYKKSEPTWLFVTGGETVNIMFGANCPKLMSLITEELRRLGRPREITYKIDEMLPIEVEIDNKKNAVKREKIQKELDEKERKRSDYFNFVTDTIHENLPDAGITIFAPHIQRDTFRNLLDYGPEKFKVACKDRRSQILTREQFELINYACKNPIPNDIIEAVDGKEVYVCFWKTTEELKEPIYEILQKYAEEVQKPHKLPPDEYHSEEQVIPPLAMPARVKIEFELPAGIECPIDENADQPKVEKPENLGSISAPKSQPSQDEAQELEEGESEENEEVGEDTLNDDSQQQPDTMAMPDLNFGLDDGFDDQSGVEEQEEVVEEIPTVNICTKTVIVPPIWVPKDWRTHAAVIYAIFRGQTSGFLPPDPVPEPPHVIMSFDTYKKKDLIDFAERNKEDIPFYGFFTSDEVDNAKFIANSKANYALQTPSASDKLIFKVNKRTSHTMLSLVTYGPTYVSPSTAVGAEEAKVFFPENYITAEAELLEALAKKEAAKGKKGKKVRTPEEDEISLERLKAAAREAEEQAELELHRKTEAESAVADEAAAPVQAEAIEGQATEAVAAQDGEQATAVEGEAPPEGGEQPAAIAEEENALELSPQEATAPAEEATTTEAAPVETAAEAAPAPAAE